MLDTHFNTNGNNRGKKIESTMNKREQKKIMLPVDVALKIMITLNEINNKQKSYRILNEMGTQITRGHRVHTHSYKQREKLFKQIKTGPNR